MNRVTAKVRTLYPALNRLAKAEGRIARRNARRAVFGILKAIRLAVDYDYPAVAKPARELSPEQKDLALIKGRTWRQVEYRVVNPGIRIWDRDAAQDFVTWFCSQHGLPAKPIRFDIADGSRLLGRHDANALRMKAVKLHSRRATDAEKWRTLLHEVAHYRAHGHGQKFKLELLHVWRTWKTFMAERRRKTAGEQLQDAMAEVFDGVR